MASSSAAQSMIEVKARIQTFNEQLQKHKNPEEPIEALLEERSDFIDHI